MLVVHCSDTPDDEHLRAIDIQHMHLGFGWDGIGYHYVIGRDGRCEAGRPEFWQGAHVRGVNDVSLGVCLIGRTDFTTAQMHRLELLLRDWTARYPQARVVGHRDATQTDKTCPNFDAAAWWQTRITARMTPIAGSAEMLAKPEDGAALETESLFGESLEVLDRHNGYLRVKLATDGYEGWVKALSLAPASDTDKGHEHQLITAPAVVVSAAPDVKSRCLLKLSLGARIMITDEQGEWLSIALPTGGSGYLPACACAQSSPADDYVGVAETFAGVAYHYGGRSHDGLDCSALVQLSLQAAGIACPRNSGDQKRWARTAGTIIDASTLERGDLLFWPGHVAICQSGQVMLHANAHHHAVTSERIDDALPRLADATGSPVTAIRLM
jgi:hypothetical protein